MFTKLLRFPGTFTARLAVNSLFGGGGGKWSLEAQSCKMSPTFSVIICYLGSLPSPGWNTVFHSSCFCCCCCLVFWVLFLTFQQMPPCRNGFRQVCLRQKKDGQGKCTAYFHTLALGNYLPI